MSAPHSDEACLSVIHPQRLASLARFPSSTCDDLTQRRQHPPSSPGVARCVEAMTTQSIPHRECPVRRSATLPRRPSCDPEKEPSKSETFCIRTKPDCIPRAHPCVGTSSSRYLTVAHGALKDALVCTTHVFAAQIPRIIRFLPPGTPIGGIVSQRRKLVIPRKNWRRVTQRFP